MKIRFTAILSVIMATFAVSCSIVPVTGSGNIKTVNREFPTISSLQIGGQASVEANMGDSQSVVITTDDNILDEIEMTMQDEKLIIRNKYDYWLLPTDGIKVKITFVKQPDNIKISGAGEFKWVDTMPMQAPDITLGISGSGDMRLKHTGSSLNITLSGSGKAVVSGSSQNAYVSISGSGEYNAFNYATAYTRVDISGSGLANVMASDNLDCIISGSGNVNYKGSPTLSLDISGSGTITRAD